VDRALRTLGNELGVEVSMQHAAQRVLEQAQPLVGTDERLDLGAESLVLAGRHLPKRRHRQVQKRQAEPVRQSLDWGGQLHGFGEVSRHIAGLQPGELIVSQIRARVQDERVDQGASTERFLRGDAGRAGMLA
jgi:hypothetical protein